MYLTKMCSAMCMSEEKNDPYPGNSKHKGPEVGHTWRIQERVRRPGRGKQSR